MELKRYLRICWALSSMICVNGSQHNEISFNEKEINEILKLHNNLRRSIFNTASMRELTWNSTVALASLDWGSRCEYTSRPDKQWGLNLHYFYGKVYHKSSLELLKDSFNAWSNGTLHNGYGRYGYCGTKNACSYVQLIAADVRQVGCSITKCPKLQLISKGSVQMIPKGSVQRHSKFLVCFYFPWVNLQGTEEIAENKRCAACPTGTKCVNNLCSEFFHEAKVRLSQSVIPSNLTNPSISGIRITGVTQSTQAGINLDEVSQRHAVYFQGKNRDNNNIERANLNREHAGTIAVHTPNNRVIPFPGKSDRRDIRLIENYERQKGNDLHEKQEKMHTLELVATNMTVANVSSGYLDDLTREEQFYTISAHNVIRRGVGIKDLTWSNYLERWAKYVIRREVEYPGPIACYTNFGKAEYVKGQAIYHVVYQWNAEGDDVNQLLKYGCRTPADKSLCNHSTIIHNISLTQIACAAKNCGRQRQLTCIYSSG